MGLLKSTNEVVTQYKQLECWQLSCQFPAWKSPVLCSFDRGNSIGVLYEQIFHPPYNLARLHHCLTDP